MAMEAFSLVRASILFMSRSILACNISASLMACTPLTWLESIITPPLVGDHLLDEFGCFSDMIVREKKAPPAAASIWPRAVGVSLL
jgi:hypothetical protein